MSRSRQPSLAQRLVLACVALLFVLQPLGGALGSCTLRARLAGRACCCEEPSERASHAPATKSCCAKRAQHDAPAPTPSRKKCGCQVSAPTPVVPPGESTRLPELEGALARLALTPVARTVELDLALLARTLDPPGAHAPPGFASAFHVHLAAGLARALSFERSLRS